MFSLQPWVHYIPVDYFLSNVKAAYDWAQAHPKEVDGLIRNAQEYARVALSRDAMLELIGSQLRLYGSAQRYMVSGSLRQARIDGFLPLSEFKLRGAESEIKAYGACSVKHAGHWGSASDDVLSWSRRAHENVAQWRFFHLPKAAGSSLANILVSEATRGNITICDGKSTADVTCRHSNAGFVHGHAFMAATGPQAQFVTFLREPISRVQSLYHYMRTNKAHPWHVRVQEMSIVEFVESHPEGTNEMARMLCGPRNGPDAQRCSQDQAYCVAKAKEHLLADFAVVGIQECFAESLAILSKTIPWVNRAAPVVRKNVTPKTATEIPALAYGDKAAIIKHNLCDIQLYYYGVELFRSSLYELNRENNRS